MTEDQLRAEVKEAMLYEAREYHAHLMRKLDELVDGVLENIASMFENVDTVSGAKAAWAI
jgi:hypothetical protein